MAKLEGVILAAGLSSRMGFPKALMPIGQSFFLFEVYRKLVAAGVTPVHIVINTGLRSSLDAQVSRFEQAEFVLNNEPAKGQIHSLQLGLMAARQNGAEAVMVALVDQPYVEDDTVAEIAGAALLSPDKVVVPVHENTHGHPFVIPAKYYDEFINAPTTTTARDILHALTANIAFAEVEDPAVLNDVDSPQDLFKL